MENKSIGSIVVDESGNVVLLTAVEEIAETLPGSGNILAFDAGVVLRGSKPLCSPHIIKNDAGLRVVSSIGELLRLLEGTGVDLTTRAEKPLDTLTELERLERLEKRMQHCGQTPRRDSELVPMTIKRERLYDSSYGVSCKRCRCLENVRVGQSSQGRK